MTESPEQINNSETVEKVKRKCLLLDDDPHIIILSSDAFGRLGNFVAVQCDSVEKALEIIKKEVPKILFLDHRLTRGGNEGLEIADKVKEIYPDIEIYSTTSNENVFKQYQQRGIPHIDKHDVKGLRAIIAKG